MFMSVPHRLMTVRCQSADDGTATRGLLEHACDGRDRARESEREQRDNEGRANANHASCLFSKTRAWTRPIISLPKGAEMMITDTRTRARGL